MEEINHNTRKLIAEQLYVKTNMLQKHIAKYLNVTEKTIGEWIKKDKWEQRREEYKSTRASIVQSFYMNITRVIDKVKSENRTLSPAECDSISKLTVCIEKLSPKTDNDLLMNASLKFVEFVASQRPDMRTIIETMRNDFISEIITKANKPK